MEKPEEEAMSPKKTILKTLAQHRGEGGTPTPVRPANIPGFEEAPGKFQQTINDLLKDRLIEGAKGPDGHMAISLNSHREKDIRRALRPLWAHPGVLALLALSAALAGVMAVV
jgi:hypothetical protein